MSDFYGNEPRQYINLSTRLQDQESLAYTLYQNVATLAEANFFSVYRTGGELDSLCATILVSTHRLESGDSPHSIELFKFLPTATGS